jgi:hypothetical protein
MDLGKRLVLFQPMYNRRYAHQDSLCQRKLFWTCSRAVDEQYPNGYNMSQYPIALANDVIIQALEPNQESLRFVHPLR